MYLCTHCYIINKAELTPEKFKQAVEGVKGTMKIKQIDATTLILTDKTGYEMSFTRK